MAAVEQFEKSESVNDRSAPEHSAHSGNGRGHAAAQHDEHEIPNDLPRPSNLTVAIVAAAFALILAVLFVVGWVPHHHRVAEANADASEQGSGVPVVEVELPKQASRSGDLMLPCDVKANQETDIFPRANGYLKKFYFDIQDHVEAGQLLAEIDTPEVDAQLAQSRAAVEQAEANGKKADSDVVLAQKNLNRFEEAARMNKGSVTEQQLDEMRAALDTAKSAVEQSKASVAAANADVQRLMVLQGYEKVFAPFSGTITARNYDVGALMNPATTGPGKQLFSLAQVDTLRVFVNVPQSHSTDVKVGGPVYLQVRNYSGRDFQGTVARTSGAIDPATRTMAVELHFPNKDNLLYAGMYGQVRLPVTDQKPVLVIRSSALLFDAAGTRVATVKDGKIHMQKVNVARDLGTELEVDAGLAPEDQVVSNPGERLGEGVAVKVPKPPQAIAVTPDGSGTKLAHVAAN